MGRQGGSINFPRSLSPSTAVMNHEGKVWENLSYSFRAD